MTKFLNCGVYRWLNTVNGKSYVGSSNDIKKRKNEHLRKLASGKHENPKFQNAWIKYEAGSFEFEILAFCKEEDLLWQEQLAINAFDAVRKGYNISPMAGAPMRGRTASLETRLKLSKAGKGRKQTSEHVERRIAPLRGIKRSMAIRARMSLQRRGNLSKRQLANLVMGRVAPHSFESRIKTSQASRLVWLRPERRTALALRTQVGFEQAMAEYLQNPIRCEVCNKVVMPLPHQQSKLWVNRLRNRKHCSRACANKVKNTTTFLKKENAAFAATA
jgi:group I intron endonuclease